MTSIIRLSFIYTFPRIPKIYSPWCLIHSFTYSPIHAFIFSFSCISLSLLPFIHHSPLSPFIHPSLVAPLSTPLSLPILAFTHSPALFTCYLIHPLTQPLSFTHVPIVFTRLTHPLIQPCTESHIHTSTFSHSLIYQVNCNQYTQSFIYSINYSFGHLTIFSITISFIHFIIYSLGPTTIPSITNSFIYTFTLLRSTHSFHHSLILLAIHLFLLFLLGADWMFCSPSTWTKAHVQSWLRWAWKHYNIPGEYDLGNLDLTGLELCFSTKEDFKNRSEHGGLLYEAFIQLQLDIPQLECKYYRAG